MARLNHRLLSPFLNSGKGTAFFITCKPFPVKNTNLRSFLINQIPFQYEITLPPNKSQKHTWGKNGPKSGEKKGWFISTISPLSRVDSGGKVIDNFKQLFY